MTSTSTAAPPLREPSAVAHTLVCTGCGAGYPDDGLLLRCPEPHPPALLQTRYNLGLRPRAGQRGLARFSDWLPARRPIEAAAGRSVVYHSTGLGPSLGLSQLWIAFNGYWPERSAELVTCSFKELEAYTVLARLPAECGPVVVPSIGNTAAAFAAAFGAAGRPCLLLVPETGAYRLRLPAVATGSVALVVLPGAAYSDAIALADRVCAGTAAVPAGGVWNVARRDGLGTVLLAAVEAMDGLPEHYVQAIGSGVGAIAAWEAARRVDAGGLPRMLLCQNAEDAPVAALRAGRSPRPAAEMPFADELLNPSPPYAVSGGLRDVLDGTGGRVLTADRPASRAAQQHFARCEGIDIDPAPALAVACLAAEAAAGRIDPDARILLNVTGGGRARLAADLAPRPVPVAARVDIRLPAQRQLAEIERLLRRSTTGQATVG